MVVIKNTCRMHEVSTGHKRISFDMELSGEIELPLKTKMLVEYDTELKTITIKEL